MGTNDRAVKSWSERLQAQSVDAERVGDAEAAGAKMATAADGLDFTPEAPIAPGKFVQLLVRSASEQS